MVFRNFTLATAVLATAAIVLTAVGCSKDETTAPVTSGTPQLVAVYPSDGATNVPTGTGISLVFNGPMDTASVRTAFHFSGGAAMYEWMDSLSHHVQTGGMGGMMGGHYQDMDHMMTWMDSIEEHGSFEWNDALDSCIYWPDSALESGTNYMSLMYGNIEGMGGGMRMMQDEPVDSTMFTFTTAP